MAGRQENQWHAGGLVESQAVRDRNHVHLRDRHQFTVAAVRQIAKHGELPAHVLPARRALGAMIAEVHGRQQHSLSRLASRHVFADLNNLAGNVAAENMRQRRLGCTLPDPEIEMVHRASLHLHQHLVLAQNWIRNVFVLQYFWPPVLMNANRFHDRAPSRGLSRRG